jgi:UDP-N-acetylmuramoyl-L-alanyl-D-glutamate--2,6-diaminopimelate ligase
MNLSTILKSLPQARSAGPVEGEVVSLTADSRKVAPGSLFFALRGSKTDGHQFIDQALAQGALAIVAESDVPVDYNGSWTQVKDSAKALAVAASEFYHHPANDLKVAGVTGTNGKTTTALIIQHLMASNKGRCGFLGTIRYDLGDGETIPASHTTPDGVEIQRLLDLIRNNGCAGVAMEVSSHALEQQRVAGVEFDAAVFTNLTQDHLDYHGTMDAYRAAKGRFFEQLTQQAHKKKSKMIINLDDFSGKKYAEQYRSTGQVVTYGMSYGVDFRIADITTTITTTSFTLEVKGRTMIVRLPIIGRFNVFNAAAALAAVNAMGFNLREATNHIAKMPQVPGRLQSVGPQRNFRVFVDYAHTPDALENVLKTLRGLNPRRIITLCGCGGDRDVTKRPIMAHMAETYSDRVILTSDNPRTEDPAKILDDMAVGMRGQSFAKIPDREEAIKLAIEMARDGDIILLAGKGHETYQIFADRTIPFDDVRVASFYLRARREAPE